MLLPGLKIHNTTVDKAEVFTGATWKTVLTEDIGQVLIQETFASSNVRFFGELALPATQGWTDTATGSTTIDLVTQTVGNEWDFLTHVQRRFHIVRGDD